MSDDEKIIEIKNLKPTYIPEQKNREGKIILSYGGDEDGDAVEVEGSITLNEACLLHRIFGNWLDDIIAELGIKQ